jgi:hypothetical protein
MYRQADACVAPNFERCEAAASEGYRESAYLCLGRHQPFHLSHQRLIEEGLGVSARSASRCATLLD